MISTNFPSVLVSIVHFVIHFAEIMKFQSLIFASLVAAAAVEKGAVSDAEIIQTLLDSPWLLPRSRMSPIIVSVSVTIKNKS